MKYTSLRSCWTLLALGASVLSPMAFGQEVYRDTTKSLEVRVNDLLGKLTLEEKVGLIHASSKFSTAGVPRLHIPPLWMSDGPHGVREEIGPDTWNPAGRTDDFSTAVPVGINLAATWDPEMGKLSGTTIGQEALVRNKNIMLGPGVNIMRTPLNGRNFEYLGEDPFLAGQMAVGFIEGEQSQGIAACVKHFAANNQETQRNSINVEMDDRTLHEIYLPAFKAAVKQGNVLSVMGAYNRFRGVYCCENPFLLNTLLKGEWGFKGLVMSDWGGAHSTEGSVRGGLDLEMGTNGPYEKNYLANPFIEGLKRGIYPMSLLDEKVSRVLRVLIATHAVDTKPTGSLNTRQHQINARKVAEEGIVLLKNDHDMLPLDDSKVHSIAVIGRVATQKVAYGGQSSGIKAFYEVPILEGLLNRFGSKVTVSYSPGYPEIKRPRKGTQKPSVSDSDKALIDQAVKSARQSEIAIVVVGLNHNYDTESSDRPDMKLPAGQDELVSRVLAANPKTIVVLSSGSPVEMGRWLNRVPALVECWYGGMEAGNAVARVLAGDVNPSGKLPCTFPQKLEDTPTAAFNSYPGENGTETYLEGLLVGYRWYDAKKIQPLFPFGFGLSYTKFDYSGISVVQDTLPSQVVLQVANSGPKDGEEVVQVYVHPLNPSVPRPPQELKAFKKIMLSSGEKKSVALNLPANALAYYEPSRKCWVIEKGTYEILVGSSSRDIRLRQTVTIGSTMLVQD